MAKKEQTNNKKEKKENNKNKKSFFKDFKAELKRVIWPTPKQLFNNTVAVITIVLVTAVIVFVLDVAFESLNKYGVDKIKESVTAISTTSEDSNNTTTENSTNTETNETNEQNADANVTEENTSTEANETNTENNAQ